MDRYLWLPDHQQHVVYSLAHSDELIARTGRILQHFTAQGTLNLGNVAVGNTANVTVTGIASIPQAIPRLAADALNQLRSALEHVVYAEIVHQVGRPLTPQEARCIEMPAAATAHDFDKWLKHRHRSSLAPLQLGAALCERLRDLQPFRHSDPERHPLRVLVEHTNWSKHRTPSVAATLIGAVIPDGPAAGVVVSANPNRPVEIGDVLASGPAGVKVPLDIWPKISIRRPHSESWHILLHELRDLEQWVREVALPVLITGTSTDVPPLPPHLDTTIGYEDFRAALAAAHPTPAAARVAWELQVEVARNSLARIITLHSEDPKDIDAIKEWTVGLDADEVLQKVAGLQLTDPRELDAALRTMIADARETTER
ncbi:hypothetical protein [Herbidospora sp. NBRC 101105]|uniref:hypothetical protein n=1 Tax=Herbidospora sp. NBRC 101105 TaxID=3032195 RepID=UPI0024A0B6AB|nr:hypothetical protein [Herbidospora sp. NBRC 101105]GLX95529.1 hypothetical protein Hesp01_34790 [Herbidospora sp. NBRC 101105]